MKKIITFFILMFLINLDVANATCSYEDKMTLNNKAANIKATYEIEEKYIGDNTLGHTEYSFKISVLNVTEDFYITVRNNYNDNIVTYNSSNAVDEIITFSWKNVDKVTNFTIKVYTAENTGCPDESIKTFYLTTPRFNDFSGRTICVEYPEHEYCQKFVTFSEITDLEFSKKVLESIETDNKVEDKKEEPKSEKTIIEQVINYIDNYKFIILSGFVLVIIIIVIINKRRAKKQRELGL